MCLGMNPDKLTPGQRCASTSNRNFEGRQGPGGRTHLLSPAMAAAAALAGKLADVRDWQPKESGVMQAFTTLTGDRRAAAHGERGHGQDHPGALPEVDQPQRLRQAPLRQHALPRGRDREPRLRAEPAALPRRGGADRLREFRLRLVARARALGAARFRHPLRHRARLRRHLPQQLLQERRPAGAPAARGLREADGRRPPRRQRAPHRGPGARRWWCARTARRSTSRWTRSASTCC